MMLKDHELREWLENLAPTNEERRQIITDLLRHKGEDHMIADDIADCRKAIGWLDSDLILERPGPIRLSADSVSADVEH